MFDQLLSRNGPLWESETTDLGQSANILADSFNGLGWGVESKGLF